MIRKGVPSSRSSDFLVVLGEYVAARKLEPKLSPFDFIRYRDPYLVAHHNPKQHDFVKHVWNVKGVFLCKGCVLVLAGFLIGLFVFFALRWYLHVSWFVSFLILFGTILPTVVSSFFNISSILRRIFRFLLGCYLAEMVLMFFSSNISVLSKLFYVLALLFLRVLLSRRRHRLNEVSHM